MWLIIAITPADECIEFLIRSIQPDLEHQGIEYDKKALVANGAYLTSYHAPMLDREYYAKYEKVQIDYVRKERSTLGMGGN